MSDDLICGSSGSFYSAAGSPGRGNNSGKKPPDQDCAADELIVKFKSPVSVQAAQLNTSAGTVNALFTRHRIPEMARLFRGAPKEIKNDRRKQRGPLPNLDNIYKLKLPPGADPQAVIKEFKSDPNIEYAEPNYIRHAAAAAPNDPLFSQQWALAKVQAPAAWEIELGDPDIVAAVLDTGVYYNHPDLAANIWTNPDEIANNGVDDDNNGYPDDVRGWDFVSADPAQVTPGEDPGPRDNDPMDFANHGTTVAGLIAGVPNNNQGISGISWHNKIMPLRTGFSTPDGASFLDSDNADAIKYAADNGARVINMSWGSYVPSALLEDALNYAYRRGCLLIASAGNDGKNFVLYPAAYENVLAVAATDENDKKAVWGPEASSNSGAKIAVAAPGKNLYTTILGDSYGPSDGTSSAAPYVAGLAGLIVSHNPALTNSAVYHIIRSSADPVFVLPGQQYLGSGRINALKALTIDRVPDLEITFPKSGEIVTGAFSVTGTAGGDGFQKYKVEYGLGTYPSSWTTIKDSAAPVSNGALATLDQSLISGLPGGQYKLRITVNESIAEEVLIVLEKDYRPGWPVTPPGKLYSENSVGPVIGDIDNDGQDEIVVGDFSGNLSVYKADGTRSWHKNIAKRIATTPSLADINRDGFLEILVGSYHWEEDNYLYALDHKGAPVWSANTGTHCLSSPVISDINRDGYLEIIASTIKDYHDPAAPNIYIWGSNGQLLPPWPKPLVTAESAATPSVGDLDNDGKEEIVVGFNNGQVAAVKDNGSLLPPWPQPIPYNGAGLKLVQTAIADVNNDGNHEIIANCVNAVMHIWDKNGVSLPRWPQQATDYAVSPPAIGDLDNDGDLEIFSHSNIDKLYGFHHDGTAPANWPVPLQEIKLNNTWPPPVIVDANGDGLPDILDAGDGNVWAWSARTDVLSGFPKFLPDANSHSLSAVDIDRDGKLELIAATSDKIYIWNLGAAGTKAEWPQFQHDARHTGNYHTDVTPPVISHAPVAAADPGSPIPIAAEVADNSAVLLVSLFYKNAGASTFQFSQLNNSGGKIWQGSIPASAPAGGNINYYLVAHDSSLNPAVLPLGSPGKAFNLSITDNVAPAIIHAPVVSVNEGQAFNITARITDNSGESPAATLYFRTTGAGPWQVIPLTNNNGTYTATIPGGSVTMAGVQYYIQANDRSSNVAAAPAGAPTSVYNVSVSDNVPPAIGHSPLTGAYLRKDLPIVLTATDNVAIKNVALHYRIKGSPQWATADLTASRSGNIYSGAVPAAAVTLAGVEYYLEGSDSSGNVTFLPASAPGSFFSIPVSDDIAPASPANLTALNDQDRQVSLSWTAPAADADNGPLSGLAGYNVAYRDATAGGGWTEFVSGATTAITIPGLLNGRVYEFKVQAFDNADPVNVGDWSELAAASPSDISVKPSAPSKLKAVSGQNGQIPLSWQAPAIHADGSPFNDLGGYKTACQDSTIGGNWVEKEVGDRTSYLVTGLTNGHIYICKVKAYDTMSPAHESDWSDVVAAVPAAPIVPDQPKPRAHGCGCSF
ncbi:MAG: S8 family serine peptidase [Candidatus Saganbacteria bacterium]|nr:S8 family serine peptidase [Candidatus Saganbacteria bacterium]